MLKEEALYGLFHEVRGPHGEIIKEKERIGELGSKAEKEQERKHLQDVSPKNGENYNIFTVEFFGNSSYYNPENPDKIIESVEDLPSEVEIEYASLNADTIEYYDLEEAIKMYLQEFYDAKVTDFSYYWYDTNTLIVHDIKWSSEKDLHEDKLLEYTTYWFGEREYPSKKVDHGEYDPHTGEFADGTTLDDLEDWELEEKLNESVEDDFWHLRDLKEPKYGTGNLILDGNKIRPLTSDEVANKFAVSIEHADKGDLKTKKELIDFANRTDAEKIMFFFMPGDNYSGEYSFLYSDEDKVRDIWKKYKQYAYAEYDDRGEYHEITESLKEEYDDYDYDRLKSELESGDWTNITAGLVPSDYDIHNYGPEYSGYEDLVIDAKKVNGKYNVYFYLETQNGPVEGEEPDEDYPTYEFDTFEQLKDFINSDYHIKKITEDIDEYTLRDELESENLFELSSLVDEFSSCTSGEECDEIKSRASFLIRKLKIDDKLVKKLNNYFKLYLEEDIEKHETLNDKIFDVETQEMLPEVREKLLEIADNFVENVHEDELDLEVKDIVLIGSNANYNYTKDSDLDVHIIASSKPDCNKKHLNQIYQVYKSMFNKNYDITIHGIPTEIYVEMDEVNARSGGIYSIKDNKWLKQPKQFEIPDIDYDAFYKEFEKWEERYFELVDYLDEYENASEEVDKYIDDIYEVRQKGIERGGETDTYNLVFKEIRNRGYLDHLKDLKTELASKEMSLESIDK